MGEGFRINGRAKPGQGKKWYYGLNYERIKALKERIQDNGTEHRTNLQCLFSTTQRFLLHASDLARSGQKDAARNWVRFFANSHILEILADAGLDVSPLKSIHEEVSTECHPQDTPEFETDIQAIRFYLEEILLQLRATEAGQGASPCCPPLPDTFPQ